MITRTSTASELMPQIQKRIGQGLKMINIVFRDRIVDFETIYDNSLESVTMDNSKFIRCSDDLAIEEMTFSWYKGKECIKIETASKADRFSPTDKLVQINYSDSKAQIDNLLLESIWIKFEKNSYTVYAQSDENMVYDIIAMEYFDKSILDDCIHYTIIGASPSGERRKIILAGQDGYDWNNLMNKATDGFLELNRGEKSYKDMAKQSAKLFQCLPGSAALGKCRNIAICFGKFNEDIFDGMCWASSEGLAWHIKESKGYEISPRALDGMFIQGRIAQGKYGTVMVPNNVLMTKINYLDDNPIYLGWESAWLLNHNPNITKVIIIGDKNAPIDILIDGNSLKSIYDYSIQPEYTILRVLHGDSPANFSSTIFVKMDFKNPELAQKIAYKLFQYHMIKKTKSQLKGTGRILSIDTFDKPNIFMRDVLIGAFPDYARQDQNIAFDILKNIVKGANKSINRLNFEIKGGVKGIVVGPENLYKECQSILGPNEIYSKTFERTFKKLEIPESERKIFAIKYPSMDNDEYSILNCISLDTIKDRINTRCSDTFLKNMLFEEYASYQDSIMVVPSSDRFREKHAGLDFDTDMMTCVEMITDEALKSLETHEDHDEFALYNDMYNIFKDSDICVKITQN